MKIFILTLLSAIIMSAQVTTTISQQPKSTFIGLFGTISPGLALYSATTCNENDIPWTKSEGFILQSIVESTGLNITEFSLNTATGTFVEHHSKKYKTLQVLMFGTVTASMLIATKKINPAWIQGTTLGTSVLSGLIPTLQTDQNARVQQLMAVTSMGLNSRNTTTITPKNCYPRLFLGNYVKDFKSVVVTVNDK